ncbi:MAG: hypothetical protein N3B01_09475 [Verrucomicrobiae bacterium]|nr:hypothetical protein [Verrucomicrobiae bacterium]
MTSAELSDAELVWRTQAGELEGFEELVDRRERMVYTLARRIVGRQQDPEDVTQQSFLSALENLGGFRSEAGFATWLTWIETHAAPKVTPQWPRDGFIGRNRGAGGEW